MTLKSFNFIPVNSSNIEAIAKDFDDLIIKYKSGLYRYFKVPDEVFENLKNSESKGKFVNENIKGKYEYVKIQEVKQDGEIY